MSFDFFLLGTTLILMHEMDAMRCKEWRIFPGLSLMSEKWAMPIFVFAHVPLFYWLLLEISRGNAAFVYGFDIFLIVHLLAHVLFLRHKKNEFVDVISWTIIVGAAVCGALDLAF